MKLTPIFLLSAVLSAATALASDPEPVKVYCYSEELREGFKDDDAEFFCYQLDKRGRKKSSLVVVENEADADMVAEFLSAESVTKRGETTFVSYGLVWTPDEAENRETALIRVGTFSKPFIGEGINASAAGKLIRGVEEWIRENRETILEKAAK